MLDNINRAHGLRLLRNNQGEHNGRRPNRRETKIVLNGSGSALLVQPIDEAIIVEFLDDTHVHELFGFR